MKLNGHLLESRAGKEVRNTTVKPDCNKHNSHYF